MARRRTPFLTTYVMVALAAGLGAYLYFVESKREPTQEQPKEKVLAALKDAREKVKEITVARPEQTIHLVKGSEGWRMASPLAVRADPGEVDSLLAGLESLEVEQVVGEAPADLGQYGLAAPRATVTLALEGSPEPLRLLVGDKTPDGTGLYAKRPAQPRVFTVPSWGASSLEKKPFELRDRSLLRVRRDEVRGVEVDSGGERYALQRDARNEWTFTRPLQTRAGRWSVDGLLGALENLRMESVAAEEAAELAAYGLAAPAHRVRLKLADGTTRTLEIGGSPDDKQYYAREASSRLVAVIAQAVVDDLGKGMRELRAKRLLEVAAYEVEGVDVEGGGAKKVLARSSGKDQAGAASYTWKRTAPSAADLDTNKVQDALFLLGGVEVQEFVDRPGPLSGYGLEAPALRLTIRHEGGKPPLWVELGSQDGAWYARRADDAAVLKLDPAKAEELVKAFQAL